MRPISSLFFTVWFLISCKHQSLPSSDYEVLWIQQCTDNKSSTTSPSDTIRIEEFENNKLVEKTIIENKRGIEVRKKSVYDTAGTKIYEELRLGGTKGKRTDFFHDLYGNITKSKTYDLGNSTDTVTIISVNKLNTDSLATETYMYFQGKLTETILSSYVGKRLSEIRILKVVNDSSILQSIDAYTYDNNGNKISHIIERPDSTISEKEIYSYNSSNDLIEEQDYDGSDSLTYNIQYFYSEGKKDYAIEKYSTKTCRITFTYIEL